MSKENVQQIQAKKKLGQKLSQKLQQIPTKNRYKIQNNNARAASGARPKNGAGAKAPAPFYLTFLFKMGRAPPARTKTSSVTT